MINLAKNFFRGLVVFLFLFFSTLSFSRPVIIAVLLSRDLEPHREALAGFTDSLKESGIKFLPSEFNLRGDPEKGRQTAAEIVAKKPDLVLALGTLAARSAQEKISEIPTVFANVLNPRASGLIKDFHTLRKNMTGVSLDIPPEEIIKILIKLKPTTKKIGLLYHSSDLQPVIAEIRKTAEKYHLTIIQKKIDDLSRLPAAVSELTSQIDAFWMVADSYIYTPETTRYIILQTLRHHVPFIGLSPSYVKAGALFCLYWDSNDVGRQAGKSAERILKGAFPNSIPVSRPRKKLLYLNEKVASELNIKIPAAVKKRMIELYQ